MTWQWWGSLLLDMALAGFSTAFGLALYNEVLGAGSVTVATGSGIEVYPTGSTLELRLVVPAHRVIPTTSRSNPRPRLPAEAGSSRRW